MGDQPALLTADLVLLDVDLGPTKYDTIHKLAELVAKTGRADAAGLEADVLAREEKTPTGLGGGIAIPHCRSEAVKTNSLAFARLNPKVDFGAADGPADLAFMIAASAGSDDAHLQLLALLARNLMRQEFTDGLRSAKTPADIVALVNNAIGIAPEEKKVAQPTPAASGPKPVIVAVTACPTGIAHTFMAADGLEQAAKKAGVEIYVEPQGSGKVTPLDPSVIKRASAAIFATDVEVRDKARFAGLPVIESGVKRAINEPGKLVAEALAAAANPNAPRVAGDVAGRETAAKMAAASQKGWGERIRVALMTGVSYMIPFVAAGGLLIALAFLLGGYNVDTAVATKNSLANLPPQGFLYYLGAVCMVVGKFALNQFMIAALSGYIAFALAGRPGIAPGFVGGAVSVAVGAGFLGGLVTGLMAGFIAMWIANIKAPRWLAGLMPVVIIPLITTFITGTVMFLFLGGPLATATTALQDGLKGMPPSLSVLLGIILGLMMCFDLGGPVNKAAYLFASTGLKVDDVASLKIMAAVMAAGMVPPIAMALATTLRPKMFSESELENGRAAWLLGASFISEGAIPFAAADPFRVIPSMMLGGAVTGALSMLFGVTSKAPHGGIFVFFAIEPFLLFLLNVVIGAVVAAAAVLALMRFWPSKVAVEEVA